MPWYLKRLIYVSSEKNISAYNLFTLFLLYGFTFRNFTIRIILRVNKFRRSYFTFDLPSVCCQFNSRFTPEDSIPTLEVNGPIRFQQDNQERGR
jgi:hypothetical protein